MIVDQEIIQTIAGSVSRDLRHYLSDPANRGKIYYMMGVDETSEFNRGWEIGYQSGLEEALRAHRDALFAACMPPTPPA